MLETISSLICSVDDVSFEQYFNQYIMDIQDTNILSEIKFNIERNHCTILDIERLAQSDHERLGGQ